MNELSPHPIKWPKSIPVHVCLILISISCICVLTQTLTVGFVLVGEGNSPVTEDDVSTLDALCEGVRLAAEIVDKPTNFMHTDAFLDVSANSAIIDSVLQ